MQFTQYLPSKKILSFLVLIVGLVVGIIIAFGGKKATDTISNVNTFVSGSKIDIPENPDWKEDLSLFEKTQINVPELEEGDTITDSFSRSLVSNYISLKQTNQYDSVSQEELINQALDFVEKVGNKNLGEVKLKIINYDDNMTIAGYGELLGGIFKKNKPKTGFNELAIITNAINEEDPNKIKELDGIINIYKQVEKDLISMYVPRTFEASHSDLVYGIRGMIAGLEEMSLILTDPARGLVGLNLYQESGSKFIESAQATIGFLKNKNIIYKQGSGGYYLMYGI